MNALLPLLSLDALSYVSLTLYFLVWVGLGWWIEHPGMKHPSVTILMSERRRDWMKVFVTREPRIFDSQIIGQLRQGTSFFASTCLIALGGVLAVLGNPSSLQTVADTVGDMSPLLIWQAKLAIVALFLTNAFLKFVWANRVFGYCGVMMGAVPNDPNDPLAYKRAAQAAELNVRAAMNFNRGLRSVYFAIGAMAFLLGWQALLIALVFVSWVVWSREFASVPRSIILDDTH